MTDDNNAPISTDTTAPVTASDSTEAPTPDPSSESPVQANLEAEPVDPETAKTQRVARALAQATKAERKAAERERQAEARVKAAEARIQQAEAARDELNGLLTDAAKNPDKALALLKKAGIPSLDALARLVMQLEPEPEAPNAIAQRALDEARELREQLKAEREAVIANQQKAHFETLFNAHIAQVNRIIDASGDAFDLVKENGLQGEVLTRSYAFIKANNLNDMTADDETLLLKHFAAEVEAEQSTQAQSVLAKLTKIKKLGINTNNNSGTTPDALNQVPKSESLGTDLAQVAESAMRQKPSKFITNESTVSSKPLPRVHNTSRRDNDAIEAALRAMDGK